MPRRAHLLKGKRVILRRLKHTDAKHIHKHAKHKEIAKFTELPHPYRLKHAKDFIKDTNKRDNEYSFGIQPKESKEVIGIVTLSKIDSEHKKARIGFWLGKEYHGKGIMSEALPLALDFAFNKLKLNRVSCSVFKDNIASHKLVEKFGFKHEGISRQEEFRFGKYHDTYDYGLLREEWLKRRKERS